MPIFTFNISKDTLDKKFSQNILYILVSFASSFIYMHSCERKKSLLFTVAMQNVIKNINEEWFEGQGQN